MVNIYNDNDERINDDPVHLICPYCNVELIEESPGNWECPECKAYGIHDSDKANAAKVKSS